MAAEKDQPELELEDEQKEPGPDDGDDDDANGTEREVEDEDESPEEGGEGESEEEGEEVEVKPRRSESIREIAQRRAELEQREAALRAAEDRRAEEKRQADEAAERETLSRMTEDQQVQYHMAKKLVGIENQLKSNNFAAQDATDRAEAARVLEQPRFKKFAAEVERGYRELTAKGVSISRLAVLDYIVGKSIREGGRQAASKQRRDGERRIEKAQGRPGAGRSNVGGNVGRNASVVRRAEQEDWSI
jgi:colicin import membrane protein